MMDRASWGVFGPTSSCLCRQAGRTVLQPIARFAPPPVVDGETVVYEWINLRGNSEPLGTRLMKVSRVNLEIPCFRLYTVDRFPAPDSRLANRYRTESTVVTFNRADLTPLSSLIYPAENDTLLFITTLYQERNARIITRTSDGDIENRLPTGALTYDFFQLPFLCRSLKIISTEIPLHILVITPLTVPPGGMSTIAELSFAGTDTVGIPAGSFECEKILVHQPYLDEIYWIEKTGARRIILYKNLTTGRGLRLTTSTVNP